MTSLGPAPAPAPAFGVYVHVPFCTSRCGYCDFNTYTATELGGAVGPASYPELAVAEVRLAAASMAERARPADTVFFGGGTPTLLAPSGIARILAAIRAEFGLHPGAEVTVEANPESVDEVYLADLRAAGATRLSLGMQSARPHVLATLDRRHSPGRPEAMATAARALGFDHVSLDLIYGTPGETHEDWRRSLLAALSAGPDHVSAYALTVEPGTRLAAQVRRGDLLPPEDDVLAERYAIADELLLDGGLCWYEVSNWSAGPAARCRHNVGYWRSADWWGIGPGAHSHLQGVRWWNVKHPSRYAARLADGALPVADREEPDAAALRLERLMLSLRLADGVPLSALSPRARRSATDAAADGLLDVERLAAGDAVLTLRGRLLANRVICDLSD